jgi:hypothetical protein
LQGHVIEVISNRGTEVDIQARIKARASNGKLKHVLLIGDTPLPARRPFYLPLLNRSSAPPHVANETHRVPAHYMPATITRRWGGEPLIATDNYYADLDFDQSPDLAVGRLTADTPAELTAMIEKIIAYERNDDVGPWRTRINFVAGAGGFGLLADKLLERVAGNIIRRHIPATYQNTITYAAWQSPSSAPPDRFRELVIERLNEGGAFWVYIGHGDERRLVSASRAPVAGGQTIFSAADVRRLNPIGGPSIALFLACRTGGFDKRADCLAEELLRAPAGPVAVIAGSRVTMPYAMSVLGQGLMTETFEIRRKTIGEVILHAKRRLLPPASDHRAGLATVVAVSTAFELIPPDVIPITQRMAALRMARLLGTLPANLMQERAEHVALFNLLGDPLLRLRHPRPLLEAGRSTRSF